MSPDKKRLIQRREIKQQCCSKSHSSSPQNERRKLYAFKNGDRAELICNRFRTIRLLGPLVVTALLAGLEALAQTLTTDTEAIGVRISITSPAYSGMPIWVSVDTPNPNKIHYPSSTAPSDFGCNTLEVKHGSTLLTPGVHPKPAGVNGAVCGWVSAPDSPESRLPLHIQYPLKEPGTYLVRYTRYGFRFQKGHSVTPILEQSDWTPLVLRTPPRSVSREWLSALLANQARSPGMLVGDALPSLLATRNRQVFRAMLQAMSNSNEIVSLYASNTIPMFESAIVQHELSTTVRREGPSEGIAYAFSSYGKILAPVADHVANFSLKYLHSEKPTEVAVAVHILYVLQQPYYYQVRYGLNPRTLQRIDSSLLESTDRVVAQKDEKAALWLARYLGVSKSATARVALWKLVNAQLATEQSLICLGWRHDASDLSKIVAIVETYDPNDPYGYQHSGVVNNLTQVYGDSARPYFREILSKSKQVWVRVAAAKELALMGDAAGYQFFIETLEEHPFYRDEMVRWLQQRFPMMPTADEAGMFRFLELQASEKITP